MSGITYVSLDRKPQVGERVRVVREGTVTKVGGYHGGPGDSYMWLDNNALHGVSLEPGSPYRVEIMEQYETEAVYVDACGAVYQFFEADYCEAGDPPTWNALGNMNTIPFDRPLRPLRMIVDANGKPVA